MNSRIFLSLPSGLGLQEWQTETRVCELSRQALDFPRSLLRQGGEFNLQLPGTLPVAMGSIACLYTTFLPSSTNTEIIFTLQITAQNSNLFGRLFCSDLKRKYWNKVLTKLLEEGRGGQPGYSLSSQAHTTKHNDLGSIPTIHTAEITDSIKLSRPPCVPQQAQTPPTK